MPLQRDKAKQLHARRNFRPHPRVTPKAIVRERIDTVRKKGIYLLPNLFTLSSLFSGFYAVIIAMAGDFEKAAIAIFVSMILDGCDGPCGSSDAYSELFRRSVRFLGRHVCFRYGAGNGGLPVGSP